MAANATGEAKTGPLRLEFDRSVKLVFSGSSISSDAGLLLHRELDDALGLTGMAADLLADPRTGKNGRHHLAALLRQSIFSRLAGYEDVNDAHRLCRDPVMRQLVGGRAVEHSAASASAMGRFETGILTQPENLAILAELPGRWIDAMHDRRPQKSITLDMDSSESPVHGDQEGSAWNGHFQSKCLHPLFVFNQLGDLERCSLRPGNVHSADGWEDVLRPVLARYAAQARPSITRRRFRADAAFAIPALFDLLEAEGWDYAIRIKGAATSGKGIQMGTTMMDELKLLFDLIKHQLSTINTIWGLWMTASVAVVGWFVAQGIEALDALSSPRRCVIAGLYVVFSLVNAYALVVNYRVLDALITDALEIMPEKMGTTKIALLSRSSIPTTLDEVGWPIALQIVGALAIAALFILL